MTVDSLGQICALLAALTWAVALLFFKRSGEQVPPMALNIFKNVIGLVLLAVTLALQRDGVQTLRSVPREDLYLLVISGFIGIALADTIFFYSLNLVGVGIVSIVDCLYSPSTIFFAWLLIGERLSPIQWIGAGLVLAGVLVSTRHEPPPNRTRAALVLGILLCGISVALMGLGIVLAKLVLQHFPLLWATTVRLLAGTAALALFITATPNRNTLWSIFRPSRAWTTAVPASILSTYVCLLLWVAGFKYTRASIAAVLNQTSTVFAIVLAAVVLKEKLTPRKIAALALAMSGVVMVFLG
ncbi:MAG TPA: DMT family transporter [Phycisphaerae bacterium]|jgi:drug/metabolite transporter (DMT)-like permease